MTGFQERANFIWQVADDLLRNAFKAHEYGDVTLPFVVLRRLDLVFQPFRDPVQRAHAQFRDKLSDEQLESVLMNAAGSVNFYNTSHFDLQRLTQDAQNIALNFNAYLNGFSANVREILEHFNLSTIVDKMERNDLLFLMCDKMTEIDLHPSNVSNHEMGQIFEELLRRFSEMSNETAGEHYTPREVIRLMVNLLLAEHEDDLKGSGIVRSIFDPACGTGGMLTSAQERIREINPDVEVLMYGQEINDQTYAIAKSDFLVTGEDPNNIRLGSSFSQDRFRGQQFDYMLSNPPFGVSWKKEQPLILREAQQPDGRFAAGTPRVSDGALLFLQHMISKMTARGSRIAVVFNGSPLFTGDAGGGESEIRRWIIENDWLEAIVALPTELFFNTGIATYIWLVTNRKPAHRKGKVQLINAVSFFRQMRKSLGNKRKFITPEQIDEITDLYRAFEEGEHVRIYDNEFFGYTKVTVERPLKNDKGRVQRTRSGEPKPDTSLRDTERIPLLDDIGAYFEREVLPHVTDAWMDRSKDKVGYEINFTRYFYQYEGLRPLEEIVQDILALEAEMDGMLKRVLEV